MNKNKLPVHPWQTYDSSTQEAFDERVVFDADGRVILEVFCENPEPVLKLTTAAPELLEAAKDVCGLLFLLDNVPDDHPAYQRLKEAIKKAQP